MVLRAGGRGPADPKYTGVSNVSLAPLSLPLVQVGEDRLIRFSGCKSGSACSIILRGASSHLLDEAGTRPYRLYNTLSLPLEAPI